MAWVLWALLLATSSEAQGTIAESCKTASQKGGPPAQTEQSYEIAKSVYDVRMQIRSGDVDGALTGAKALAQAHPSEAAAQAVLGEVYFRRGQLLPASTAIDEAVRLDTCYARGHLDAWQILTFVGMRRKAQEQLQIARDLDNTDTVITWAWNHDQRLSSTATGSQCHLVGEARSTTVPLEPRLGQADLSTAASVRVKLNDKTLALAIDSADSIITLGDRDARRLGLVQERTFSAPGHAAIGGSSITGYMSHVHRMTVGAVTLEDCPVRVQVSPTVQQGGLGLIPFRNLLITLDVKAESLRLDPLPPLPESEDTTISSAVDRYVPPSMRDWNQFYSGPVSTQIFLPVSLGGKGGRLFVLDTGSFASVVDVDVAKEITSISRETETLISGYGGAENEVYKATKVPLRVGNLSRVYEPMLALSLAGVSNSSGVSVSGILGFDLIRDARISIDYRDFLLHLEPNTEDHRTRSQRTQNVSSSGDVQR